MRKSLCWVAISLWGAGCASLETRPPVPRLAPRAVHDMVKRGEPILLVCAYDAKDCRGAHLEGSLTLAELERRQPELPRNQRIVFYCG